MLQEYEGIFLGSKIGNGCYRDVYNYRLNEKLVVKIERDDTTFSNILEYKIWEEVQYADDLSKWFAPCIAISPNGKILIQKKAERALKKDYPKELPAFFSDIKMDNFGFLDGRLVCFDYGSLPLTKWFGMRMKKADWF